MNHQINYKNHTIVLDGITAQIHYQGHLIHKIRTMNPLEAVKSLKDFITLRDNQLRKESASKASINTYA